MAVGRVVGFDHVIDHGVDRADDREVGAEYVFGSNRVGSAASAVRPFNPPYPTDTWRL